MQKTVKIDSKTSITLDNNVSWMLAYRDQFGRDIVPLLIPALNTGINLAISVAKTTEGGFSRETIAKLDSTEITDAIYNLAGMEMTDIINIIWAMAKTADEEIEEPRVWVRQFNVFPLDVLAPAVVELAIKGLMTTKNFERLQGALATLKSVSTPSSSQDNGED